MNFVYPLIPDDLDMYKPQNEDEIKVFLQPRVRAVDWNKYGLVSEIEIANKRRLPVMRYIPSDCKGKELIEKIREENKANKLTIAEESDLTIAEEKNLTIATSSQNSKCSDEADDWYDVDTNKIDWYQTGDGEWCCGPTNITKKVCRRIPTPLQLQESVPKKFDIYEESDDKRIFRTTEQARRSSYFVSMDDFEMFHFVLKDTAADSAKVMEQLKGVSLAELKNRRFADKECAARFAKNHMHKYYENVIELEKEDDMFDLVPVEDSSQVDKIQNALATIFQQARAERAVLIFSDLFVERSSTKAVERALDVANFDGPVLNFSTSKCLVNPEIGGRKYGVQDSNGEQIIKKQGLLSQAVTHSFEVDSEEPSGHTQAAMELAAELAGIQQKNEDKRKMDEKKERSGQGDQEENNWNPDCYRVSSAVCILVAGSLANLQQISNAIRLNITLLVLQGSGKLSNVLPSIYLSRNDLQFDAFQHCEKLVIECGLLVGDSLEVSALLSRVLQSNGILIHNLENGVEALRRTWASVSSLVENKAMVNATKRRDLYTSAANANYLPTHIINLLCISISFSITLFATIQGYTNSQASGAQNSTESIGSTASNSMFPLSDTDSARRGLGSSVNPVLHYLVVALPIVLSVLSSFRQDLNYGPKFYAFTYGAAVIDSEVHRYKTKTGEYSDTVANKGSRRGFDAAAGCSEKLSRSLVLVSASLNNLGVVTPDQKNEAEQDFKSRAPSLSRRWKLGSCLLNVFCICSCCGWRRQSAAVGPTDHDERIVEEPERLSIDSYVDERLRKRALKLHHKASILSFWLNVYKSFVYIVSASSSVLGLLGFEVRD